VGLWLGCAVIAGGTYVLASMPSLPPTTFPIAKAAAPLQSAHSLPSPGQQRTDGAALRTEVASPSVADPNIAAKAQPVTAVTTVPTNPPTKSMPAVPTVAEVSRQQEEAPAALTETNTPPAISVFTSAQGKPDNSPPAARLSAADRALFARRGSELLATGDIASARLFFERAAEAGDAQSAFGMAITFDPVELARAGVRGLKSDQAKADYWYQRARSLANPPTSENLGEGIAR
jgi:TPR repeat protein